jgi:hypothetical protein
MNSNNGSLKPPLSEKKFITESPNPYPFWMWLAVITLVAAVIWGVSSSYESGMQRQVKQAPFLQVTNRDLSLFLWQFPEHMRIYASVKDGYLPGFEYRDNKVGIVSNQAEQYAIAPPGVLFLYHTWSRLLKDAVILRPFSYQQLSDFLQYAPEWIPDQWPAAPASYRNLVEKIPMMSAEELSKTVPALPNAVQIAITGWHNFFKEGPAIEALTPTYQQVQDFLQRYPHYARPYWRNILMSQRPQYLEAFSKGSYKADDLVPINEMAGFLKVAIYNDQLALSEQAP